LEFLVGVFGATGYAGRELVRILSVHPRLRTAFTTGTGEGPGSGTAGTGSTGQAAPAHPDNTATPG